MRHISLNVHGIALLFVLLNVIGLVGCGSQIGGQPSSGGQNVAIDRVNFIRFHGITYLATPDSLPVASLAP